MIKVWEVKLLRCVCHNELVKVVPTDSINSIMCEADLYCSINNACINSWSYGSLDSYENIIIKQQTN